MTTPDSDSLASGPHIRQWPKVTEIPAIGFGNLHIWRLDLNGDATTEEVYALLSVAERSRAQAINNPTARHTYARARAAKRQILAGYLGIETQGLQLDAGPRGKPFIAAPETDLQFNLTHSGALALLAVTPIQQIGLDVEQIRPRKGMRRIAERMFGAPIAESLHDLAEEERQCRFHVLWTRLEAGVKACGGSLFDSSSREADGLSFSSFVPLPGYQACIAMSGGCPKPDRWLTMTYSI